MSTCACFLSYYLTWMIVVLCNNQCLVAFLSPARLCNSVEFVLAALTERVPTNPWSPAPAPVPAPAPAPAPALRLPFLLFGRQQEHNAGGHQDVPQWVCVVVVALRLGKNVQAYPDQGAECAGNQVEHPAFPRRRVTMSPPHPSVHLSTKQMWIQQTSAKCDCTEFHQPSDVVQTLCSIVAWLLPR